MSEQDRDDLQLVAQSLNAGQWLGGPSDALRICKLLVETRKALAEACEDADEGWEYAGDFFREKWRDEEAAKDRRALLACLDIVHSHAWVTGSLDGR